MYRNEQVTIRHPVRLRLITIVVMICYCILITLRWEQSRSLQLCIQTNTPALVPEFLRLSLFLSDLYCRHYSEDLAALYYTSWYDRHQLDDRFQ